MAFNNTVVARVAAGIFGLQLGYGTTQSILAQANSGTPINTVINGAFNDSYANVSNADIAAIVTTNVGLTGQAKLDGNGYITNALIGVPNDMRGAALADIINLFSTIGTDPVYGTFANDFNARVAAAVSYASTVGTNDQGFVTGGASNAFFLSTGQDNMSGTSGNDTFNAYVFDNQNTLQSGDFINGGGGADTLFADMGSSPNFAVTPRTQNVENIVIRAQSSDTNGSSGNNNIGLNTVNIDAERIVGATRFESNNSRADLIIEDVRILQTQITKDITVAFVQSDPGYVDFGVYFDQASLTANRTSSSSLILQVLDTKSAAAGLDKLLQSPYDGISFSLNGQLVVLQDDAINNATTYPQLLAAIQGRLLANSVTAAAGVTAALGADFSVIDADSGQTVTGTSIVLSASGAIFGIGNWLASQGVPANSTFYTNQLAGATSTQDLVTSTVILDDVGRGSNGGDLVIGGLSVGETSNSRGVDRFEITVERTSRLQHIGSTNNWLKEVTFKNGTTNGNVSVLGSRGLNGASTTAGQDTNLPGAATDNGVWGFNDVRLIDASAMVGSATIRAAITAASFNKYILLTNSQIDPAGNNVSVPTKTTQVADFIYSGGAGNDSFTVQIDGGILASNSNIQVGREDFSFTLNGNAGNDTIIFRMVDSVLPGQGANWYANQKLLQSEFRTVKINGGTGDDTIRTPGAGDTAIDAGDGNDTIYTDNTGAQGGLVFPNAAGVPSSGAYTNANTYAAAPGGMNAVWVFNTFQAVANTPSTVAERNLENLKSDVLDTYDLYKSTVNVNFKGLEKALTFPVALYDINDLYINQRIKEAINLDPVLSKLLVAVDGPAYSLVVKSLIDGTMVIGDLTVTVTAAAAGTFSAAELQAVYAAYGGVGTGTVLQVQAILDQAVTDFNTKADYATLFGADTAGTEVIGLESVTTSDNRVSPGAGNDVIVLGTTVGASLDLSDNDMIVYASGFGNDTIVNFEVAGNGIDQLNVASIGGRSNAAFLNDVGNAAVAAPSATNRSITIDNLITGVGGNDTAARVALLFADQNNTAILTHVFIAVDTVTNIGTVYSITDPVGQGTPSAVTAVLSGTIDLADTLWSTVVAGNFTTAP